MSLSRLSALWAKEWNVERYRNPFLAGLLSFFFVTCKFSAFRTLSLRATFSFSSDSSVYTMVYICVRVVKGGERRAAPSCNEDDDDDDDYGDDARFEIQRCRTRRAAAARSSCVGRVVLLPQLLVPKLSRVLARCTSLPLEFRETAVIRVRMLPVSFGCFVRAVERVSERLSFKRRAAIRAYKSTEFKSIANSGTWIQFENESQCCVWCNK